MKIYKIRHTKTGLFSTGGDEMSKPTENNGIFTGRHTGRA